MVMPIANRYQSPPFNPGQPRYNVNLPPQNQYGQTPVTDNPARNTGISGGISGINNQVPQQGSNSMYDAWAASPAGQMAQEENERRANQSSANPFGMPPQGANQPPVNAPGGGFTGGQPPMQTGGGRPAPPIPGQQPAQQFGLGGAEQSIRSGTMGGINLLGQGQNAAMNTLQGGQAQAQNYINQGVSALGGRGGGFGGGGFGGGGGATAQQASAANINQNAGQNQFQQGAAGINQFTDAGVQGQQRQLALSGALGQEAFDQARINDPAQKWLQQQGQDAIINQQSALGGLGGGNVMKELSRFNQGLASQNLQQERQAAGQLANQGLQAAGQAGQLQGQAGQLQGNMAQAQGQMNQQANMQNAQLGTQASMANASNQNQAGMNAANNQRALQQSMAGLYGQGAGLAGQFAGQGAGIQNQAGMNMANMLSGGANQVGALRYGAGQDIANSIRGTTGGLSGLQNQQGSGMSDIIGQAGSNASNIFTGAGGATAQNQANLAALLANLATGSGTQASNAALQGGQTQANLALSQGQNQQQLIENLMKAYGNSGAGNP